MPSSILTPVNTTRPMYTHYQLLYHGGRQEGDSPEYYTLLCIHTLKMVHENRTSMNYTAVRNPKCLYVHTFLLPYT